MNDDQYTEELDYDVGTRYTHCLFVDDICLESLDRMIFPVVKIIRKYDDTAV